MRTLILLSFILLGCNNTSTGLRTLSERYSHTFNLGGSLAELKELATPMNDSFLVVCYKGSDTLLTYSSNTPTELISISNLYGDTIPEILLDPCFADEMKGILIFHFDKTGKYSAIYGTDGLSSDIKRLTGTNFYFDQFAHNKGGETSTLFKIENDSCKKVASMFLPYEGSNVELSFLTGARVPLQLLKDTTAASDTSLRLQWVSALKYL